MEFFFNLVIAILFAIAPSCPTEDSTGFCAWNAQTQGNGTGQSFVMIGENPIYLDLE
jgi:hypothetical protein